MSDQPARKTITRPAGVRAYWVPGVEGIVLEAALHDLAAYQGDVTLVVQKRIVRGVAHYSFDLNRREDKP